MKQYTYDVDDSTDQDSYMTRCLRLEFVWGNEEGETGPDLRTDQELFEMFVDRNMNQMMRRVRGNEANEATNTDHDAIAFGGRRA